MFLLVLLSCCGDAAVLSLRLPLVMLIKVTHTCRVVVREDASE